MPTAVEKHTAVIQIHVVLFSSPFLFPSFPAPSKKHLFKENPQLKHNGVKNNPPQSWRSISPTPASSMVEIIARHMLLGSDEKEEAATN